MLAAIFNSTSRQFISLRAFSPCTRAASITAHNQAQAPPTTKLHTPPPPPASTPTPTMTWDGTGCTQEDLMLKDECILVDDTDIITGHGSKYDAHRFTDATNHSGLLHRAFSVFLFDSQNRLLLQQRAACKITFPRVWTNTCCSHPLYGYVPTEVDSPQDVATGAVPGVKRAAIRKLLHELGIRPEAVPIQKFQFLTRLHYCASDTDGGGEWGEHEIDYILFIKADVELEPNAEEVMDTKYVSAEELKEMMDEGSGLKWSPWFRIIAENFLTTTWWKDVDGALAGKYADYDTIHKIL